MNQNDTTEIKDLTATTEQQDEVKGGLRAGKRSLYLAKAPFADEQNSGLPDLEPHGEIKGGVRVGGIDRDGDGDDEIISTGPPSRTR